MRDKQPVLFLSFFQCTYDAGEDERQRAHEALQKQEAELARYAEQVAADQRQAAALQAKIKAMEEKVQHAQASGCSQNQCHLISNSKAMSKTAN